MREGRVREKEAEQGRVWKGVEERKDRRRIEIRIMGKRER